MPVSKQDALQLLDRELQRGRTKRFGGSRFRLGAVDLTRVDGTLTDAGRAFLKLHPDESLNHYDRSSERVSESAVYATDVLGARRIVGSMVDGSIVPTRRGVAYYNSDEPIFTAELPCWRMKPSGGYERGVVTVTDQWLLELAGGGRFRASIAQAVGRTEPMALVSLIRRVLKEALTQAAVPNAELYGAPSVGLDLYDWPAEVVPEELGDDFRVDVLAPGANDPAADPLNDILDRPLRGAVVADDYMYRKTGLHIDSWRDTGMCALYGLQQACTYRPKHGDEYGYETSKPRFELDELMTIFDEFWEEQREAGPRQELVDEFMPFAAKLAKKDAEAEFYRLHGKHGEADKLSLENSIATDRPKGLRAVATKFFKSLSMDEKAVKVRRLLTATPRECEDWRDHGVSARMLEKVCDRTENQLFVIKGQKVVHQFVPRIWNELTEHERRGRGCIALSINEGHGVFYACPNSRRGITQKKIEWMPRYDQHAKLVPRQDDDSRVPYCEMLAFNIEDVKDAISSGKSVIFCH
jgi:hypothetical protein